MVTMFIWPMQQAGHPADLGRATVAFDRLSEILAVDVETLPTRRATSRRWMATSSSMA